MGKITKKAKVICEEHPELASTIFVSSTVAVSLFMGYRLGQYKMFSDIQGKILEALNDKYDELETKYNDLLGEK